MKYKPLHMYELKPLQPQGSVDAPEQAKSLDETKEAITPSKADRLRELKKLLDEKVLSPEEYEKEKAKLLGS